MFEKIPNGPRIRRVEALDAHGNVIVENAEQAADGLVACGVSTHNNVDEHGVVVDQRVISSATSLPVRDLNLNASQVLYSLTKYGDRAAVVTHVLLNQADEQVFEGLLRDSNNLADVEREVRQAKIAGHGFADLNLDEVF